MGRELTTSEARILATLLGSGAEPERVRLERSGAPRSTYVSARRRAYDHAWLQDRFLPDPSVGYRFARWLLARPFLERGKDLEARWVRDRGAVLLWRWPEHLLLLRLEGGPLGSDTPKSPLVPPDLGVPILELRSDLGRPHVPVFFDFEGAWANLVETPRGRDYPRPLGKGDRSPSAASEGLRRSVGSLVARPFEDRGGPEPIFRRFFGAGGLSRSQRRLIEAGWVSWRVLPDLRALPAYDGRRARRLVLVRGELLRPGPLEELFHHLWSESRATPFLMATDEEEVLLGFVGLGEKGASSLSRPARPVGRTLERYLSGIQTYAIPLEALEVVLDHRYDRLFST